MIGIHKFCATDSIRPNLQYIQVRAGFVYATNGFIAIKIPAKEVFGENIISTDEPPFYIEGDYWRSQRFDKAFSIKREGNEFSAFSKKGLRLGVITPVSEEKLIEQHGRFPDIDSVLPGENKELATFNLNAKELMNISDCFGSWPVSISVGDLENPIYSIAPILNAETQAKVILLPCMGVDPETNESFAVRVRGLTGDIQKEIADLRVQLEEAKRMVAAPTPDYTTDLEIDEARIKGLEAELKEAKSKIEEQTERLWGMENLEMDNASLEEEVNDLKEQLEKAKDEVSEIENERDNAEKELEKFKEYEGRFYKAETIQEELIYEAFIDALRETNPYVLLNTLENLKELV